MIDTIDRLQTLINDAVLLKILPLNDFSDGGLLIPDNAGCKKPGYEGALADRIRQGIVVAVGPGKLNKRGIRVPIEVEVGDRVSFYYMAEYSESLAWPDSEHLIMPERFIQSVIS